MAYPNITTTRPAIPPPEPARPGLPALKTRNSSTAAATSRLPSTSQMSSKLAIRTPSKPTTSLGTAHAKSSPAIPTLRSMSITTALQEKSTDTEIRRSISIASFPEPPGVHKRIATISNRSSPPQSSLVENGLNKTDSASITLLPGGTARLKRLRIAEDPPSAGIAVSDNSPAQSNSHGTTAIPAVDRTKETDNRITANSPASRSSSAQGSCSTSATTFEDVDDGRRGREEPNHDSFDGMPSVKTKETKGNVIVSVRVRPDAGGNGDKKSEGEWMVDGRRSLVAYRGREGGDYYYGELVRTWLENLAHRLPQTTFLQPMTRITRFTMLLPNVWYAVSWRAITVQYLPTA